MGSLACYILWAKIWIKRERERDREREREEGERE